MTKSKIPLLKSKLSTVSTKVKSRSVDTKIKSFIKYSNIDRTKIIKCAYCKNIVDLLSEDWNENRVTLRRNDC